MYLIGDHYFVMFGNLLAIMSKCFDSISVMLFMLLLFFCAFFIRLLVVCHSCGRVLILMCDKDNGASIEIDE